MFVSLGVLFDKSTEKTEKYKNDINSGAMNVVDLKHSQILQTICMRQVNRILKHYP